jgi:hypothetical protein
MQSVSLTLGVPFVGWLPVEIKAHDFQLSCDASDLGLNVIDQLALMTKQLDDGQSSECYFYLEPGAYILTVDVVSNIALMQIQFVEDFNNQDISDPETKYKNEIDLVEFRKSLRNALRNFKDFEYGDENWPAPENYSLLDQLLNS